MTNLLIYMTIDNYLELVERSKARGIKVGESMQEVLNEMITEGVVERVIQTERSEEQIIKDLSKHWKVGDLREEPMDCVWCEGKGTDQNGDRCQVCGGNE